MEEVDHPSREPIDFPDDNGVEVSGRQQRPPSGAFLWAVGRSRYTVIDELANDLPTPGFGVAAAGLELPRNRNGFFLGDTEPGVQDAAANLVEVHRVSPLAFVDVLRTSLLQAKGTIGLIATNTVAQGDSREVGLDAMVASGFTITRAIQSRSWPASSANLEYAAVWGTRGPVSNTVPRVADDTEVRRISTLLEPTGRVEGMPARLAENAGLAFIGCYVLGMGFVLGPEEAQEWIAADARNAKVLFPYLNGEDLNSRPDASASRWVIDFGELPESEAVRYEQPWERVRSAVRPERIVKDASKYPRMVNEWWKFWNARPVMRAAIAGLPEVLVIALVSKTVMPLRVSAGQVFSHALGVFATDSYGDQAVLSSSIHQLWAITYGSGMRNDPRYTPSDVFETFPRPPLTDGLVAIGQTLDDERRAIMRVRDVGLTKLYNLVNDPDLGQSDPDVCRLRQLHEQLDSAVLQAYAWGDIEPGHGFHTFRKMRRWTVSPSARVEILDRLLEENHQRAAEQAGSEGPVSGFDENGSQGGLLFE